MQDQDTPTTLPPELTDAERQAYEQKARELATKHGVATVHPVVFIDPDTHKRIVAYLKEPNYMTKIMLMDKAVQSGPYVAGEEIRQICQIKEDSDPITYSDAPASDQYKMGIVNRCMAIVEQARDQFKKK